MVLSTKNVLKASTWALGEFWETCDVTVSNPGRYAPSIIYGQDCVYVYWGQQEVLGDRSCKNLKFHEVEVICFLQCYHSCVEVCSQCEHQLHSMQSCKIALLYFTHNSSLTDSSARLFLSGELPGELVKSLALFVFVSTFISMAFRSFVLYGSNGTT